MGKVRGRPIHGVICKEDEIQFLVLHRTEKKCPARKSKLDYKFSEDEIEELCRP
ncbi:hypothetical protein [[Eubacterium] cellulosolvens]